MKNDLESFILSNTWFFFTRKKMNNEEKRRWEKRTDNIEFIEILTVKITS